MYPVANQPGVFQTPEGRVIKLSEWDEMDVYDTIVFPGGETLQAISEVTFFTAVQGKAKIDTNLTTNGKVPARHELLVLKAGIFVAPKWGAAHPELADQCAVYQEGTYELLKNQKPQVYEQHMWGRQTGMGFVAYGVDFAVPAVTIAPGSLGVASPAAIPPLLVPFSLAAGAGGDDDFEVDLRFTASRAAIPLGAGPTTAAWTSHTLAEDTPVMAVLHGFMKAPGTR